MKTIISFLLVFCSLSLFGQKTFKTDTIYYISISPLDSVYFKPMVLDLRNSCNSESSTTIDLYTHNVPDAFHITTIDTTLIVETPFFGALCPIPNFPCQLGYIHVFEDDVIYPNTVPVNHEFNQIPREQIGRITFFSSEEMVYFWITPNPTMFTNFAFYVHPSTYTYSKEPVEIFIGEYVCDSVGLYEIRTPNSSIPCDTIFIDGVRITDFVNGENFDTIYTPSKTWIDYDFQDRKERFFISSDTIIERTGINAHGCQYSEILTIFVYYPMEVYIPNVFSPNNDGINDYFEAYPKDQVDKQNIKIFSRYGGLIYESNLFSWNGGEYPPDVYVYLITLTIHGKDYLFSGDITLLK